MKTTVSLVSGAAALSLIFGWVVWHQQTSAQNDARHGAMAPGSKAGKTMPSQTDQQKSPLPPVVIKLMKGEVPKLTPEQLRTFVEKRHHSAASLLVAWRLGDDKAWLEEAASRHPDNPSVALAMLASLDKEPEEKRAWIARLQENAPENAMGWCYAALDAMKEGRSADAKNALADAALRSGLDGYGKESAREFTEAYRSAGYDGLEADILGRANVPLPQAQLVMGLLKERIAADNDDPGALADLLPLAGMLRGDEAGAALILEMVSVAVEKKVLGNMDALDVVPGSDVLVAERLAELDAERATVREIVQLANPLLPSLTKSEFKQYLRRSEVEGELKAMQWVVNQKRGR